MTNKKRNLQESFDEFSNQHEMGLASVSSHTITWYESLAGANKALKVLQMLIGGEIRKGQRILETYTTNYTVENCFGEGRSYCIMERVKDDFITERHRIRYE